MRIKSVSFYARMVAFLLAIAALGILDFIFDLPHGLTVPHFMVEIGIVLLGLGGRCILPGAGTSTTMRPSRPAAR